MSGTSEQAGSASASAFELLHPQVQRWVHEQRWTGLRDVQERSIAPILAGRDVLIAAPTAGGKTEAAFLPICTALAERPAPGVRVLYLGPLKALINDQHDRLDALCARVGLPVHPWHGDVASSRKRRLVESPDGVLLITPESLEALLVTRGPAVGRVLAGLHHVVWDELHASIEGERGRQIQSLLHRVELVLGRRVPRVGLSATLGDMALAAAFLRPGAGDEVTTIVSGEGGRPLRLLLRGVVDDEAARDGATGAERAIAERLYRTLRGTDNLAFANSRRDVELYADLLARRCAEDRVPNEFFPHHGSLSKESREEVERQLKDRTRPATAVCTSTLELGIDVGSVTSIAQVGAPPSVAALRQRLGRSGRRDEPAILRLYVREPVARPTAPPQDALRTELVQTIAAVRLLLVGWFEPPPPDAPHGSTLVQQLLSLIAQTGGVTARDAYRVLCAGGPFPTLDAAAFAGLLRHLAGRDLIEQAADGDLLLGGRGERIVGHYSFYAAFATPEEYQLVAGGKTLGSLPLDAPLAEGATLVFSGRRWRVLSVDDGRRVIELAPAGGGRPPTFGGGGAPVHDRVRREMRDVLEGDEDPGFLDETARSLLAEARGAYDALGLRRTGIVEHDGGTTLFPWAGDRVTNTLLVLLLDRGLQAATDRFTVTLPNVDAAHVRRHLRALRAAGRPDPIALAAGVRNRRREKYDWALPPELLAADYAARSLDAAGTQEALSSLLASA